MRVAYDGVDGIEQWRRRAKDVGTLIRLRLPRNGDTRHQIVVTGKTLI